jgi:hypothetical protein
MANQITNENWQPKGSERERPESLWRKLMKEPYNLKVTTELLLQLQTNSK